MNPSLHATDGKADPRKFGRIDADGNVWVQDGDSERMVGGYPDGLPEDPLALYVRRYADLDASIRLFESRLPTLGTRDIDTTLAVLQEQVVEPAAVGDLPSLRERVKALEARAAQRKEEIKEERASARAEALEHRTQIVDRAEVIAAQPTESTQWKNSGQELRDLLDQWKSHQRSGPRLDKSTEDELWKRFSAARTTFDRNRRQFFAALDARLEQVKRAKEELIARAEQLQDSDDWGGTSQAYRQLMNEWKQAGRASRKDDDALWARFRAAQQVFFDRRRDHDQEVDTEFSANLEAKEAILVDAEALLPVTDVKEAKRQLRDIQDRWEAAGRVPSRDVGRVEGRLRAVEQAVREAEDREWQKSNPETQARAQGMLSQLEDSIAELEADKAKAEKAGDSAKVQEIEDALATKRTWLEQVRAL